MRKVLYIFGLLTDADIAWMAQTGVRRRIRDGEILIQEGRPIGTVILLLQGEYVVADRALGEIGSGSARSWAKCRLWIRRLRPRP
jgi:hypothetical protein